ncbi:MAG: thiol peroxidase [Sulfurovum sp.]|nr:thiol peroxidase [Sulfurovum sp.]MCB4744181.1 thiol peroxidase [Sulfurovum sp.]MCB4746396.1 thiol peroxidase [Sulfurovum sp.]MCB4747319.1 thiol peroxidase [Sulfurovum sp.]MCB4749183.1 thiol peroxidase [Sulfurovum sp.]
MATVTFKSDIVCNLAGTELNIGDTAPVVTVVNCNPMLQDEQIGGEGKVQLIIAVPSLDTGVCDAETRRFNTEAASLDGVEVMTVSMDLPFAAARWCGAAGIENIKVCSDFRNKDFANAYGVLLADGPLAGVTARVIFVVGKDGKVAYKQVVPEITEEPNYNEAIEAAKSAANA